jgi:hypothetical protein
MTDELRKAAEMALEALEELRFANAPFLDEAMEALRQALAQPEQEQPKHWSDCSVYNEPAYPNGECDCGGFDLNNKWHGLTEEEAEKLAFDVIVGGVSKTLAQPEHKYDYRIKYDRPCYKCLSNFCPGNCKAPEHLTQPVDTVNTSKERGTAKREHEPVAWIHNMIEGGFTTKPPVDLTRHPERWTALYSEPKPCPTCEALARAVMMDQTAYDTAPPKQWVGLTDEEINKLAEQVGMFIDKYGLAFDAKNGLEDGVDVFGFAEAIEAKLKEKNT